MTPGFLSLAAAVLLSFVLALLLGRVLIPVLRRMKVGQSIKEDGPVWHMGKAGTPTMGGILFITSTLVTLLVVGGRSLVAGQGRAALFVLLFSLVFGGIGFLDDYAKVKKKENTGLTAKQKFLLQLVVAVFFIVLLRRLGLLSPNLYVPFFGVEWKLPWGAYLVFAALVITGTVNAVNITDGVDGLAAGVTMPVCAFYAAAFTYGALSWQQGESGGLAVLAAALFGGLAGFLVYNFHPAKVFMGDTGSLFLGGAVCGLAFALNMPLILIPVGIIYIIETLSDIIQVGYFKLTHGKRFFKMAPIHHHFEKMGWSEEKLFGVFAGITLVCCVLAFFGVVGRYPPL